MLPPDPKSFSQQSELQEIYQKNSLGMWTNFHNGFTVVSEKSHDPTVHEKSYALGKVYYKMNEYCTQFAKVKKTLKNKYITKPLFL